MVGNPRNAVLEVANHTSLTFAPCENQVCHGCFFYSSISPNSAAHYSSSPGKLDKRQTQGVEKGKGNCCKSILWFFKIQGGQTAAKWLPQLSHNLTAWGGSQPQNVKPVTTNQLFIDHTQWIYHNSKNSRTTRAAQKV